MKLRPAIWFVGFLLLAACGQRGPLYLPAPNGEHSHES